MDLSGLRVNDDEGDMYDFLKRGAMGNVSDRAAVTYHRGGIGDFLNRHEKDATRALRDGMRGVREVAPHLFNRIADPRTLRAAWDFLARHGGSAPGVNGRRYADYTSAEVWSLCRCLTHAIRDGSYRPGPERIVWIDKSSGRGQRPIVILNIEDRVVQRAVVLILQPVLDPLFDDRSFGFRPRRGHLHALALAEYMTLSQQRRVWVAEDIRDAFVHVPIPRLVQVVQTFLPAGDLLALLETVLPAQNLAGLRQGGSLSPLMLNVYLHHFLDRPWRSTRANLPLIRVADDLLVLCKTDAQAQDAHAELQRLLQPTGMPLKGTPATTIHRMDDASAEWMGFSIRNGTRGLAMTIANRSWTKLRAHLALMHTKSQPAVRARQTIRAWLTQRGPCYPSTDRPKLYRKIASTAAEFAFDEIPGADELQARFQRAYARWGKLRHQARLNATTAVVSDDDDEE